MNSVRANPDPNGSAVPQPWQYVTTPPVPMYTVTSTARSAICPDLLRLSDLGEADNWRGRVVRGFFRVLAVVTGL